MFSQLFLTTGLIAIPIIFFIMTSVITQKNLNYINPNSEKRVSNSELFLSGLFKILYVTTILFVAYFAEIAFVVFKTKQLVFILFIIFLLLVVFLTLLAIANNIFIRISNFEIRVSHIKDINYTKEMEDTFNSKKSQITIYTVLAIIAHLALVFIDIFIVKSYNLPIMVGMFLLVMLPYFVISKGIGEFLDVINNDILSKQVGYLSDEDVIKFKKEHKEKEDMLKTIKELRDNKIKEIKKD